MWRWYADRSLATRVLVLMAALIVIAFVVQRVIGGSSATTTPSSSTTPDTVIDGGPPSPVRIVTPKRYESGKEVIAHSACLACHQIGRSGNRNLAADLTHVGSHMSRSAILRSLDTGPGIMPSYRSLGLKKLDEVADFLSHLK